MDVRLSRQLEEKSGITAAPDRLGIDDRLPTKFLERLHFRFRLLIVIQDGERSSSSGCPFLMNRCS